MGEPLVDSCVPAAAVKLYPPEEFPGLPICKEKSSSSPDQFMGTAAGSDLETTDFRLTGPVLLTDSPAAFVIGLTVPDLPAPERFNLIKSLKLFVGRLLFGDLIDLFASADTFVSAETDGPTDFPSASQFLTAEHSDSSHVGRAELDATTKRIAEAGLNPDEYASEIYRELAEGYAALADYQQATDWGLASLAVDNQADLREDVAFWAVRSDRVADAYRVLKNGKSAGEAADYLDGTAREIYVYLNENPQPWLVSAETLIEQGYLNQAEVVLQYAYEINNEFTEPGELVLFGTVTQEPDPAVTAGIERLRGRIETERAQRAELAALALDNPTAAVPIDADQAGEVVAGFEQRVMLLAAHKRLALLGVLDTHVDLTPLVEQTRDDLTVAIRTIESGNIELGDSQLSSALDQFASLVSYYKAEQSYASQMGFIMSALPSGIYPGGPYDSLADFIGQCQGLAYSSDFSENALISAYQDADANTVQAFDALWYYNQHASPVSGTARAPQNFTELNALTTRYAELLEPTELSTLLETVRTEMSEAEVSRLEDEPTYKDRRDLTDSLQKLGLLNGIREALSDMPREEITEEGLKATRDTLISIAESFGAEGTGVVGNLRALVLSEDVPLSDNIAALNQAAQDLMVLEEPETRRLLAANMVHVSQMRTDDWDHLIGVAVRLEGLDDAIPLTERAHAYQVLAQDIDLEVTDRMAQGMILKFKALRKSSETMDSTLNVVEDYFSNPTQNKRLNSVRPYDTFIARLSSVRRDIASIRTQDVGTRTTIEERAALVADVQSNFGLLTGRNIESRLEERSSDADTFNLVVGAAVIVASMYVGNWAGGAARGAALLRGVSAARAGAVGFGVNIAAFTVFEMSVNPGIQIWDDNKGFTDNLSTFAGRLLHNGVVVGILGKTMHLVGKGADAVVVRLAERQLIKKGVLIAGQPYTTETARQLFVYSSAIRSHWATRLGTWTTSFGVEGNLFMGLNTAEAIWHHGWDKGLDQSLFSAAAHNMNWLNLGLIKFFHLSTSAYANAAIPAAVTPTHFELTIQRMEIIEGSVEKSRLDIMEAMGGQKPDLMGRYQVHRANLLARRDLLLGMTKGRNEQLLDATHGELALLEAGMRHHEIFGPENSYGIERASSESVVSSVDMPIYSYTPGREKSLIKDLEQNPDAELIWSEGHNHYYRFTDSIMGQSHDVMFIKTGSSVRWAADKVLVERAGFRADKLSGWAVDGVLTGIEQLKLPSERLNADQVRELSGFLYHEKGWSTEDIQLVLSTEQAVELAYRNRPESGQSLVGLAPDGRPIYRSEQGHFYNQRGELIGSIEAPPVALKTNFRGYEFGEVIPLEQARDMLGLEANAAFYFDEIRLVEYRENMFTISAFRGTADVPISHIHFNTRRPGELYIQKAETVEEHRGNGVYSALFNIATHDAALISNQVGNVPTLKALKRAETDDASLVAAFEANPLGKARIKAGFGENLVQLERSWGIDNYAVHSARTYESLGQLGPRLERLVYDPNESGPLTHRELLDIDAAMAHIESTPNPLGRGESVMMAEYLVVERGWNRPALENILGVEAVSEMGPYLVRLSTPESRGLVSATLSGVQRRDVADALEQTVLTSGELSIPEVEALAGFLVQERHWNLQDIQALIGIERMRDLGYVQEGDTGLIVVTLNRQGQAIYRNEMGLYLTRSGNVIGTRRRPPAEVGANYRPGEILPLSNAREMLGLDPNTEFYFDELRLVSFGPDIYSLTAYKGPSSQQIAEIRYQLNGNGEVSIQSGKTQDAHQRKGVYSILFKLATHDATALDTTVANDPTLKAFALAQVEGTSLVDAFAVNPLGVARSRAGFGEHLVQYELLWDLGFYSVYSGRSRQDLGSISTRLGEIIYDSQQSGPLTFREITDIDAAMRHIETSANPAGRGESVMLAEYLVVECVWNRAALENAFGAEAIQAMSFDLVTLQKLLGPDRLRDLAPQLEFQDVSGLK